MPQTNLNKKSICVILLLTFKTGVYIKFEIHIFAYPSLFIFLAQRKFIIMRWCMPQAKNCKPFFCNFANLKSNWEKISILFTFFNNFFLPNMIFGHILWPDKQKNIHPCFKINCKNHKIEHFCPKI